MRRAENRLEQLLSQRAVDRRHASERIVQRALGQGPEIDVVPGKRQCPGVFELLAPPDLRKSVGVGTSLRPMARDCGVDVEQRPVGIENIGQRLTASSARPRRDRWCEFARAIANPNIICRSPAPSAALKPSGRGCHRRAHRRRLRARSRTASAHRAWRSRIRPAIMAKSAPLGSQVVVNCGPARR